MTPTGGRAYVSNTADATVSASGTANRVVTSTIAVGVGLQESAVTPDGGRVFVVRKSSGDVAVAGTSTDTVVTHVVIGGNGSKDVLLSRDGRFTYPRSLLTRVWHELAHLRQNGLRIPS